MSYSITISGHKLTESSAQADEFERHVADAASAFVAELEGVDTATFVGGTTGTIDLRRDR